MGRASARKTAPSTAPQRRPGRRDAPGAGPPSIGRRADSRVFALLWLPYALLVYRFWFLCDDAFITFRYVRNWVNGWGLRYNLGDQLPVEGYSNFLWVVICGVVKLLGGDVLFWTPVLSFLCGSVLMYLLFDRLHRRLRLNLWITSIATLMLACSPAFAVWSTSGLETMPFALLLFVTFDRLILRRAGIAPVAAGIAGLATALIRVEGVYWAALLVPLALFTRRRALEPIPEPTFRCSARAKARGSGRFWDRLLAKALRGIITYAAILLVGYGIYFGCRYAYYQLLFSNSAYAKVSISAATLERGLDYLLVQYLTLLTPFLIIPGVIVALRRTRRAIGIPVALMSLAVPAYTVAVSGDFMGMGRLLVPGLAFSAILFGWLLEDCWGASRRRRALVATAGFAAVGIGVLPAADVHLVPESVRARLHFRHNTGPNYRSELKQWRFEKDNAEYWAVVGRSLRDYARPGDSLVAGAIGTLGYYSDLFIYDGFGLVTRKVAARRFNGPVTMSPGHDKAVPPAFFLEDRPTFLKAEVVRAPTRADLARVIWRNHANWLTAQGLDRRYVPDFAPVPEQDRRGELTYLVVLRLLGDDTDPAREWTDFNRRLESFARGEAR